LLDQGDMEQLERRRIVHRHSGDSEIEAIVASDPASDPVYHATVADRVTVRDILGTEVVCATRDVEIPRIVALMVSQYIGCLPIVDGRRRPVGVITKFDVVEQLDSAMRRSGRDAIPADMPKRTADDVMMPLAFAVKEHSSLAQAASLMLREDTHHVLVVGEDGSLVGVISSKDIVRWVAKHDTLSARRDASSGPPVWQPYES
jgi:CBS domain-containing protein